MSIFNDAKYLINGVRSIVDNRPSKRASNNLKQKYLQAGFYRGQAAERSRAKMYFPGAQTGVLQGDWSTTQRSYTSIVRDDYKSLCSRSELAYRTDAIMKRAVNIILSHVVGQGNRPYPSIRQYDGELIEGANDQLARDWERFSEEGIRYGTQDITMYDAQWLELATMIVYGNALNNVVTSKRGSLLPFSWQILKPTRLDFAKDTYWDIEDKYVGLPTSSNKVVHGIQINNYGESIGFWLEYMESMVSANNMYLSFFPTEAEQFIALPWATAVLPQLYDHQQLFDDKLKQSRIGARLGVKMPRQDAAGVDAILSTDSSSGEEYFDMDFQGFYFSDGKPEPIAISDPIKDTFEPLVKMTLQYIAIGMGYSYQLLTSDLGDANFAATRANIIEDKAVFRDWYSKFIRYSCQPKWNKFVEWEVMTGRLARYGITPDVYAREPKYYNRAIWLPTDTREWVDPLKDMEALKLAYKLGQTTYQEICAVKGKDWRAVARQSRTEREFLVSNGLEHLLPENIDKKETIENKEAQNAKNTDVEQ